MKSSAILLVPLLLVLFLNACSKPAGTDVSTESVTKIALVPQDVLTLATS